MNNYVISNLTDGHLIQPLFLDQEDPLKAYERDQKPTPLASTATDMDKEILKESIKQFVLTKKEVIRNSKKVYGLM